MSICVTIVEMSFCTLEIRYVFLALVVYTTDHREKCHVRCLHCLGLAFPRTYNGFTLALCM